MIQASVCVRSELASAAFRLVIRGVAVFPLAPGTKIPSAGSHGHLEASSDPDICRARWAKAPTANIGGATGGRSGFWVLDSDPCHGGDAALAELEAEHGALPRTTQAATPRGGKHLYWRWPGDGLVIRNSAGRIGPGLDVRGEGGSITLPPSVLANGRGYRWVKNGAHGFTDAPAWLVNLALPPAPPPRSKPKPLSGDVDSYCAAAITSELKRLAEVEEGQRNDQLNRSAFAVAQFVAAGAVPEDWARQQLETHARAIGLYPGEIAHTIDSAFAAGLAHPRELPR